MRVLLIIFVKAESVATNILSDFASGAPTLFHPRLFVGVTIAPFTGTVNEGAAGAVKSIVNVEAALYCEILELFCALTFQL